MAIRIDPDAPVFTLINTFSVAADDQLTLVAELRRFTDQYARHLPGFVGAAVHAGADGTRVVNYVQWHNEAAMGAMLSTPEAHDHLEKVGAMSKRIDPVSYAVAFVQGAP